MRSVLRFLLFFFALSASAEDLCFTGGTWFNGKTFEARTVCTSNGVFVSKRPQAAREVDLGGGFVVPPFGEAHNHNVEESERLPEVIRRYVDAGIFYVKNPNSLPRTTPRGLTEIDAVFAMGGLTGTNGHPAGVMKRNIDRGAATEADADGGFYHQVDSIADLNVKWPRLMAAKPDFVKTYLVYSEEYAQRKDDPAKYAWKGLNPVLLPEIVRRAHAAKLRVATHVETAVDFHHAVAAGVDEISHLPGFRAEGNDLALYRAGRFRIAEADAKRAAKQGIVVVTTSGSTLAKGDPIVRETIVANLRLLRKHGVKLAIGSDDYRNGVVPEVKELQKLGVFTNAELLDLWTRATAQAIFPGRKIGRLLPGYEASFLVLEGDPLRDFENVSKIRMRVRRAAAPSAAVPPR